MSAQPTAGVGGNGTSAYPYQQAPVRANAPTTIRGGGADSTAVPPVVPTSSGFGG